MHANIKSRHGSLDHESLIGLKDMICFKVSETVLLPQFIKPSKQTHFGNSTLRKTKHFKIPKMFPCKGHPYNGHIKNKNFFYRIEPNFRMLQDMQCYLLLKFFYFLRKR